MSSLSLASSPLDTRRRVSVPAAENIDPPADRTWPAAAVLAAAAAIMLVLPLPAGGGQPASWLGFSMATAVAATGYALTRRRRGRTMNPGHAIVALAVLALAAAAAAQAALARLGVLPQIAATDAALAALRLAGLALFAALIGDALAASRDPYRAARRTLIAVFGVLVAYAAVSLATEAIGDGPRAGLRGPFANRNSFATLLGMGTLTGMSLLLLRERQFQTRAVHMMRLLAIALGLITLIAALVATRSRMGLVSTFAGALVLGAFMIHRKRPGVSVFLFAAAGLTVIIWGQATAQRFSLLGPDWDIRAQFYRQILDLIGRNPVTGVGADGFALGFERVHRPPVSIDFVWDRAHSTYLKLWAELGVLAGSLPLLAAAAGLLRHRRHLMSRHFRFAPLTLAVLAQVGLHALFDFGIEILANQVIFVFLIGLGTIPAKPPRIIQDGGSGHDLP